MWLVIGYWVVVDVLVWESGEPNHWAFVCPQIPAPPQPRYALVVGGVFSSWPFGESIKDRARG